jgi:hypothetical protein
LTSGEDWLNETYPAEVPTFRNLSLLIEKATRGAINSGGVAGRFSVDVVRMNNIVGPHHVHTTGEVVLPIAGDAGFGEKE